MSAYGTAPLSYHPQAQSSSASTNKRSFASYSQPQPSTSALAAPAQAEGPAKKKKKADEDDWMNKEKRAMNYRTVLDGLTKNVAELMYAYGDDPKPAADSEKVMTEMMLNYLIEMSTPPPLPAPVPPLFEPITHTKVSLLTILRRNLQRHPSSSRALRVIQATEHKLVVKKQKQLGIGAAKAAEQGGGIADALVGTGFGGGMSTLAAMVGESGAVREEGKGKGKGKGRGGGAMMGGSP